MRTKSLLWFVVLFYFGNCSVFSQKGEIVKTGYYELAIPLYLAFDNKTNKVTGYIEVHADDPKDFLTCRIFFSGILNGNEAPITFYQYGVDYPETHEGILRVNDSEKITIKSESIIFPCANLIDIKNGEDVVFRSSRPYKTITAIKVKKQFLFREPQNTSQLKSYLIENDPVGIMKEENDWYLIKFLKNERVQVWIPKSSVY